MALLTAMSVTMGSPAGTPRPASDSPAEPLHDVRIDRRFAIGMTEVTREQFQRFLDANPEVDIAHQYPDAPSRMREVLARFSPEGRSPAIAVTWYEAAMYCNWLSAREGIPEREWVYPRGCWQAARCCRPTTCGDPATVCRPNRNGNSRLGPAQQPRGSSALRTTCYPSMRGSRDIRRASRAIRWTRTIRSARPPVAQLRPNDAGLFDIYGNVWEWTQDRVARFDTPDVIQDIEDTVLTVTDADARTRRGGAYPYESAMARSASRGTVTSIPTGRRDNVGFRIARTVTR